MICPFFKAIQDYTPTSEEQHSVQQRFLELIHGVAHYTARTTLPGHLTASAFILDQSSQRILLTHHRALDKWVQLGGHIEPEDRTPLDAALREAYEESGLSVITPFLREVIDLDIHEIPAHRNGFPAHLHYDIRFALQTNEELAHYNQEESREVRWCTLSEIIARTQEDSVLRVVQRLLG